MSKIKFAVENGFNILFVGPHGVGKTKGTLSEWVELGYTDDPKDLDKKLYMYFNCPVLDVYEDIKGLPYNKDGEVYYIKPAHRDWNRVELIFLDEPNRAHPKVINTFYELIQLKSVNGIKLPNLRCVFAAMNPHGEDYAVEACDQSFFDRFQLKINVKPDLNKDFFTKTKGLTHNKFELVREWWQAIPENIRDKEVSPRRVEFCIDVAKVGGDLNDVIPTSANPDLLQNILTGNVKIEDNKTVVNLDKVKKFLANYTEPEFQLNLLENLKNIPKEMLAAEFPYNKGTYASKLQSEQKATAFVRWLHSSNVLEEAVPLLSGVPNLLIAILKHPYISIKIRQSAHDVLKSCAPALAAKWCYPKV